MRAELADAGFEELYSAGAVENALAKPGTTLLVVNSVCGCAAKTRPGARMSLENLKKTRPFGYGFASVNKEAVDAARQSMFPFPRHHRVSRCSRMVNWYTCSSAITLKGVRQSSSPTT
jgi:putative YphP/YqiW family bacilliredoxin